MSYRMRLVAATGLMAVGAAAAFLVLERGPASEQAAAALRGHVCGSGSPPSPLGMADILVHNLLVMGNLLLGGLLFGVKLALQLMSIGADLVQWYTSATYQSHSFWFASAALLPHGLFELGAFASVGATGVGLLAQIISTLCRRNADWRPVALNLARELPVPLAVVALAALVEEYVTPFLMRVALAC